MTLHKVITANREEFETHLASLEGDGGAKGDLFLRLLMAMNEEGDPVVRCDIDRKMDSISASVTEEESEEFNQFM